MKDFDLQEFWETMKETPCIDAKDISEKRRYPVVKANDLIRKARNDLTLREMKVVSYIYSKIKPTDGKDTTYIFSTREFLQICGLTLDSGNNYKISYDKNIESLDDFFLNIRNKGFHLETETKKTSTAWIAKYTRIIKTGEQYSNGKYQTGDYLIQLDPDMFDFLVGLTGNFTSYKLLYTLPMSSKYSIRLYEILKSYAYMGAHTFDIDELRTFLGVEDPDSKTCKYKNFKDFRLYVLDKAQEEINSYTDIIITYNPINKGRKVVKVEFSIEEKSEDAKMIAGDDAEEALNDEKVSFASKKKKKRARERRKT